LFAAANAASGGTYAPVVTAGEASVASWFDRKHLDAAWVACDPGGRVIGHVGVMVKSKLPFGWGTLPSGRDREVARLAVLPAWTRLGIGSQLMAHAVAEVGQGRCWLTTHASGQGRALYERLGWYDAGLSIWWPDDPRAGVLLLAPVRLPRCREDPRDP
jgi:GNAT superfamily N-acetyltransferase